MSVFELLTAVPKKAPACLSWFLNGNCRNIMKTGASVCSSHLQSVHSWTLQITLFQEDHSLTKVILLCTSWNPSYYQWHLDRCPKLQWLNTKSQQNLKVEGFFLCLNSILISTRDCSSISQGSLRAVRAKISRSCASQDAWGEREREIYDTSSPIPLCERQLPGGIANWHKLS